MHLFLKLFFTMCLEKFYALEFFLHCVLFEKHYSKLISNFLADTYEKCLRTRSLDSNDVNFMNVLQPPISSLVFFHHKYRTFIWRQFNILHLSIRISTYLNHYYVVFLYCHSRISLKKLLCTMKSQKYF